MSVVKETSKLVGERSIATLGLTDDGLNEQPRVVEQVDIVQLNRALLSHDVPHEEIDTLVACTMGVAHNALTAMAMCRSAVEQYNSLAAVLGQTMAHGVLIGRRLEREGK
jgi:hypothetical protein